MKLECKDLHAWVEGNHILRGVNISLEAGKIHALMGPNGSGKSTLANVIMGNPAYEVKGEIFWNDTNILELEPSKRARLGLFMAFQYPVEIPGITVGRFLKRAHDILYPDDAKRKRNFVPYLRSCMDRMGVDQKFINRYLNEGFSGGEKKRMEILQMMVLQPRFSILDETDSGLDIDALRVVAEGVNYLHSETQLGCLVITHYQRILEYLHADFVHILYRGKVVVSSGEELVHQLEEKGYSWIKEQYHIVEEDDELSG